MVWVYILRSEKTNKYYTGSTQNVSERLKEHNAGKSKSTQGGVPWDLVYFREYGSRTEAVHAEKQIKGRGAKRFLESLIE
jgi:putative endonuclease